MTDSPPKLTTESTWRELSIALARKLMTLSHGFKHELVREEALDEALYLTDQVWSKQRIEAAVLECTLDDEDKATDFLEETTDKKLSASTSYFLTDLNLISLRLCTCQH